MKPRKIKSPHNYVAAIIYNKLEIFKVSHEEIHESNSDFGEPLHYIVCGDKKKLAPKLYLDYYSVLFLEEDKTFGE